MVKVVDRHEGQQPKSRFWGTRNGGRTPTFQRSVRDQLLARLQGNIHDPFGPDTPPSPTTDAQGRPLVTEAMVRRQMANGIKAYPETPREGPYTTLPTDRFVDPGLDIPQIPEGRRKNKRNKGQGRFRVQQ